MTAQVPEEIRYLDIDYTILAIENKWPFHPEDHGFEPFAQNTACHRGYQSLYLIRDDKLLLHNFNVYLNEEPPVWQGVHPEIDQMTSYKGVDLPIKYTGGIIIGDDFISRYYVHMGFQQPYAYENVKELKFKEGRLLDVRDHSLKMKQIREEVRKSPDDKYKGKTIIQFIQDAFDLSYGEKWS